MSNLRQQLRAIVDTCVLLGRAAISSIGGHWALGLFSLVAAFGVWIAIQDVDNPRVEGIAPVTGGIQVQAVNIPEGYLVENELPTVKVRVNARKGELEELEPGDFDATVDVSTVAPDGTTASRRVRVEPHSSNVDVLAVVASSSGSTTTDVVEVKLIKAATRDLPVTVRVVTSPPSGYAVAQTTLQPALVRVSGKEPLVQSVDTVDLEVNLGSVRDDTVSIEGALVARTASGNTVDVRITPVTAQATFVIEEVFTQRTMALQPVVTGNPAPGFTISNITVEPAVVLVTGPKNIIDPFSGPLIIEPIDVTGARQRQTATRNIERPPNFSTDRQTAVVIVEIIPIDCSDESGAPCGGTTLFLAPAIEDVPAGLVVEPVAATVQVRVFGPLAQLATIRPEDFRAVISLAGAQSGTAQHTARVTAPAGLRVDSVAPISVTLRSAITP